MTTDPADPKNTTVEAVVAKAALFGTAGWAAENLLFGPRYSALFHGRKVPFLPVYAAGGLAVIATAPRIAPLPWPVRGVVYALAATAVEYVGCQIDRRALDARSWDYGQSDGLAEKTDGCLDWKHSAMWGALGLLAEKFR